jgi:pyridoxamine 5'-phosphate oxidase
MTYLFLFPHVIMKDLRNEYTKSSLNIDTIDKDPIMQFQQWFADVVNLHLPEPNAMNLATVSEDGRPTSRIVLLKETRDGKFLFYTNYQSQKGKELEQNSACALNFFWPELERQVRIEGIAERVDAKISEEYFQSRPRASQVGAWASPQSSIIKDRSILEERVKEIEKRFEGKDVLPKPHQWGGYAVVPFEIEFWQGRPGRLHDRIVYTKVEQAWKINRLAP